MTNPPTQSRPVPYVLPGSVLERKLCARRRHDLDVPDLSLTNAERIELTRRRAQCRRALHGHNWPLSTSVPPRLAAAMDEMATTHQLHDPDALLDYDRELRGALYGAPTSSWSSLFVYLNVAVALLILSSFLPIPPYAQLAADAVALALIGVVIGKDLARPEGAVRIDITRRDVDTGLAFIDPVGPAGSLAAECDRAFAELSLRPGHVLTAIGHDEESLTRYRNDTMHRLAALADQESSLNAVAGAVPRDRADQHRGLKQAVRSDLDHIRKTVGTLCARADEYEATVQGFTAPVDDDVAAAAAGAEAEQEVNRVAVERVTGERWGYASPRFGVARRRRGSKR